MTEPIVDVTVAVFVMEDTACSVKVVDADRTEVIVPVTVVVEVLVCRAVVVPDLEKTH